MPTLPARPGRELPAGGGSVVCRPVDLASGGGAKHLQSLADVFGLHADVRLAMMGGANAGHVGWVVFATLPQGDYVMHLRVVSSIVTHEHRMFATGNLAPVTCSHSRNGDDNWAALVNSGCCPRSLRTPAPRRGFATMAGEQRC